MQLIDRPAGVTVEDAARNLAGHGHRTVWRAAEEFRRRRPLKLGLAEVLALLMSLLDTLRYGMLGTMMSHCEMHFESWLGTKCAAPGSRPKDVTDELTTALKYRDIGHRTVRAK